MPARLSIYDDSAFKNEVHRRFGAFRDDVGVLPQRYNIAPTINIPIYTNTRVYTHAHFGLIPSWAKERSAMQVNARSESVFEKSSFKEAYRQRRCLIPINGYYEWVKDTTSKKSQAYFIHSCMHTYFTCAGIYESWYDNALKQTILSCALLTTEPNETIATIHDRMPVILEPEDWALWLDEKSNYTELNRLYTPLPSEKIGNYPVGEMVNSVKYDNEMCIQEVTLVAPKQTTLF